jgi:hypothetical protein
MESPSATERPVFYVTPKERRKFCPTGGNLFMSESPRYQVGDLVIYAKTKHGVRPGPRAKHVAPAELGDDYSYQVDKFWVVTASEDESITLKTRRGKKHTVAADDPNLRKARWWERWLYRGRFPSLTGDMQETQSAREMEQINEER